MVAAVARLMDCAHDSSLLADPLRPSRLLRFTSFGESVPMLLKWAIEHDERFGIWGGMSERERRRYKKEHKERA